MFKVLKDVLKSRRDILNLKQSEIAEFVGVTPQTYMKWENGKNEPKASNIKKLAEILQVSEMEICRGELLDSNVYEQIDFMKKVASMQRYIDEVTFTSLLHKYILDKDAFLQELESKLIKSHGFKLDDINDLPDEVEESASIKTELSSEDRWNKLP